MNILDRQLTKIFLAALMIFFIATPIVISVHAQAPVPTPTPNATQSPLYPAGAVFAIGSGIAANNGVGATIAAVAGKTAYISGLQFTATGATAGSCVTATLSGVYLAGNLNYVICAPAGVTTNVQPLVINFSPPLPATATNTAITFTVPALGVGNTYASGIIEGFYQ